MTYKLDVQNKGSYLHIIVTGQNTTENVENYFLEIYDKCKELKSSNVLIEENLIGPSLSILNIFE